MMHSQQIMCANSVPFNLAYYKHFFVYSQKTEHLLTCRINHPSGNVPYIHTRYMYLLLFTCTTTLNGVASVTVRNVHFTVYNVLH